MKNCPNCGFTFKKKSRPAAARRREVVRHRMPDLIKAIEIEKALLKKLADNGHYVEIADLLVAYHKATGYAERKLAAILSMSKSEIHRMILIGYMPQDIKDAAFANNVEKYVLLELSEVKDPEFRKFLAQRVILGFMTTRHQLKIALNKGFVKTQQYGMPEMSL